MSADAVEFNELGVIANRGDTFGQILLLMQREQDIRRHTNDQRTFEFEALETGLQRAAMLSNIEQVGCTRQIQVAVRVKATAELVGMILEIHLDRKRNLERVVDVLLGCGRALPAESLHPFLGRTIRHHAELACQALPGYGRIVRIIITGLAISDHNESVRAVMSARQSQRVPRVKPTISR